MWLKVSGLTFPTRPLWLGLLRLVPTWDRSYSFSPHKVYSLSKKSATMVNITYDACRSSFRCFRSYMTLFVSNLLAESLRWTDSEGNTGVYNPGDIAWVLASTALVFIMVPGVGFFYSGLLRCVIIQSSRKIWLTALH